MAGGPCQSAAPAAGANSAALAARSPRDACTVHGFQRVCMDAYHTVLPGLCAARRTRGGAWQHRACLPNGSPRLYTLLYIQTDRRRGSGGTVCTWRFGMDGTRMAWIHIPSSPSGARSLPSMGSAGSGEVVAAVVVDAGGRPPVADAHRRRGGGHLQFLLEGGGAVRRLARPLPPRPRVW